MDVAVSILRADLSTYIQHVKDGSEVVITDRGTPVARMVPIATMTLIDQLTEQGVISRPLSADKPNAAAIRRVMATGSVSELISEQRD